MPKRILLLNSDLAKNRGDRAIAEGNIELIRLSYPDAVITGISDFPERDSEWYGINFLGMNFQSLNPFNFLKLCQIARRQDLILWGGGEILKDYTNKAALWYWVVKILGISLFNRNIIGFFQGIGPTKAYTSKKLISFIVKRCKFFITRDEESFNKLLAWGVPSYQLLSASDPAVLPTPQRMSDDLKAKLRDTYSIDDEFLDRFICIGVRDWFHYKPGGVVPYKYRKFLAPTIDDDLSQIDIKHRTYARSLEIMVSDITERFGYNILFVPMHIDETDAQLSHSLSMFASRSVATRVLDKDQLSPSEIRSVMARGKAVIGFRLHSNIIGTSAGVPSINIYYVDKGRVFFDQINQSRFALPIESTLKPDFSNRIQSLLSEVIDNRDDMRHNLEISTSALRKMVISSADKVLRDA